MSSLHETCLVASIAYASVDKQWLMLTWRTTFEKIQSTVQPLYNNHIKIIVRNHVHKLYKLYAQRCDLYCDFMKLRPKSNLYANPTKWDATTTGTFYGPGIFSFTVELAFQATSDKQTPGLSGQYQLTPPS